MVVAVDAVRMMQVALNEVVDVVAVWDGLVSTTRTVNVPLGVTDTAVRRRAGRRVGRTDLEDAFVHVTFVLVVKVTVVQVVDVVTVPDGEVSAIGAVNVIVIGMGLVSHDFFFPCGTEATTTASLA